MNSRLLTDEELNKAFDGDFGEVFFDHKPTAGDMFLVKLKLVAKAQDTKTLKEVGEELFEIVHSRTKAEGYKKAVKLWQSINQELRSNPVG